MKRMSSRVTAVLLAMIMVLTLLPLGMLLPLAEELEQETYEGPVLNETVVGTLKFQSFNFLGKNATGDDGVDYKSTFYYTDDYFSPSAINGNLENIDAADQKAYTEQHRVPWTYLDNASLAATSMGLAAASYATGAGDVQRASSKTWANTDYSDRAANARNFLTDCGFTGFEEYGYDHAPERDGIAYVLANKQITVWDEATQTNKDFTLVAVGVRGAGYGSEWASNVEIGTPGNGDKNTRHEGFDGSAQKVVAGIEEYIANNNIKGDVKYWVSGFSRAAAVANLTAGYLTDRAADFGTTQGDVYGYTWECPQAADTEEDALSYSNIHNIINAMDVVPMVSPSKFEHQRLGVDYVMPYYGNTSTSDNTAYYNRMYEVLKTIAVGTTYKDGTYEEDKLIRDVNPANYPYNRPVPIYTIKAGQLISDAMNDNLMDNFGTVSVTGSDKKLKDMYMDEFLKDVLEVCLRSGAWDTATGDTCKDKSDKTYLTHKKNYINHYQSYFQDAFAYFLDFSGPAFLDMVDAVMDGVQAQLKLTNALTNGGLALAFTNFYNYPKSTYKLGIPPFIDPWVGSTSWVGKTRKQVLIDEAKPVVRNVVHNMVANYEKDKTHYHPVTLTQLDNALDKIVEVVIELYADELDLYNSNYFGTTLHYLFTILSTHEQETVLSWIMSLDDNHISRGYRTLTLPKGTDVKLRLHREGIDNELSFDSELPTVAEYKNGKEVSSLDQRIYMETDGSNMIIRYPALLDIRADITAADGKIVDNFSVNAADYVTKTATAGIDQDVEQYRQIANTELYTDITANAGKTNAQAAVNDVYGNTELPLVEGETYQIIADGTTTYDNSAAGDKDVYSTNKKVRVTWQNDDGTVLKTEDVNVGTEATYGDSLPTKASTATLDYNFKGWSPEPGTVTTPTTFVAMYEEVERLRTAHNLTLEGNIGVNFFYYIPERYSGEKKVYITYQGEQAEQELKSISRQGYNHMTSYTVPAKEMSQDIVATLTCDGEVINEHNYPVMRYAKFVINNSERFKPELVDLAKSMLYYGSCAQVYFNYDTDNLANKGIEYTAPAQKPDELPVAPFNKTTLNKQLEQYGLAFYGSNLVLLSETTLKLNFRLISDELSTVKVTVDGKPAELVKNGSYYALSITNIHAEKLRDIHTIQIGDATFQYSACNYLANAIKTNKESLVNVANAIYDYSLKADAYFLVKE